MAAGTKETNITVFKGINIQLIQLIVLFVETPRKIITAVIVNLRGVSTNKTIICFIAMQSYNELNSIKVACLPKSVKLELFAQQG
jgi:hypothetical protein